MRKFTFLQAVTRSFHSMELYRDVARNWKGAAFGYLLLVQSVALIATGIKIHVEWVKWVDNDGVAIVEQVPRVVIDEGAATVEAEQPYVIVEPDSGSALAVLDTTGEITELGERGAKVLLTRDRLFMRKGEHETRIYELSEIDHFELDAERVEGWRRLARNGLMVFLFPFLIFIFYAGRVIQVLFFGGLGMIFARMVHARLDYPALVFLAAVSLTPAILVGLVLEILEAKLPGQRWFLFGLALLYFGRAIIRYLRCKRALACICPPATLDSVLGEYSF
jgi:hypothetical protein